MRQLPYLENTYISPAKELSLFAKWFPACLFYAKFIGIVYGASKQAQRGQFDGAAWVQRSFDVLDALESVGVRVKVSGIENVIKTDKPVVFIGNHMSMMETLLLPLMIQPVKPVTFVVKESLLTYPVFKHVMKARNPIAVTRTNPRQDLKTVMSEGVDRLMEKKISVIVFPQTTRHTEFDPKQMSSIGVKLAKKAGADIVPVALKTDCWQNGSWLKDFGRFDLEKMSYFAFGEPLTVEGKGGDEQEHVNSFIAAKLKEWRE